MDWDFLISSLFIISFVQRAIESASSFSVGTAFCQQITSIILDSDFRVICSVVPVRPDFLM